MIIQFITSGNFDEAYQLIKDKNIVAEVYKLKEDAILSENISYYTFINFLNKNGDNAELHYICAVIASTGINHFKGGYATGYFHVRKAIELEPNSIEYKKFALLFNDIPDKLLPDEVAKQYRAYILKHKTS